jgi:hypothetical protein
MARRGTTVRTSGPHESRESGREDESMAGETVEVIVSVSVRVPVGDGSVEYAQGVAEGVAWSLEAHPLEAGALEAGATLEVREGVAFLLDEGGSVLEDL